LIEYIELEGKGKKQKAQGAGAKGKEAERKDALERARAWHLECVQR
jgi:hypothetical protein